MDELKLQYVKTLSVPAGDLLLSVKGQYDFAVDTGDTDSKEGLVSLSKLFPCVGLTANAEYSAGASPF